MCFISVVVTFVLEDDATDWDDVRVLGKDAEFPKSLILCAAANAGGANG